MDINEVSRKVENLKRERDECYKELDNISNMKLFIMQAVAFWDEVAGVTKSATVNTKHLQQIVDQTAKKNTLKFLRSRGTQTVMKSFKDGWMEVEEMITSDKQSWFFQSRENPWISVIDFATKGLLSLSSQVPGSKDAVEY